VIIIDPLKVSVITFPVPEWLTSRLSGFFGVASFAKSSVVPVADFGTEEETGCGSLEAGGGVFGIEQETSAKRTARHKPETGGKRFENIGFHCAGFFTIMKPKSMSFIKRVSILGIPIDALTRAEAAGEIFRMIGSGSGHHVMTPNPEMLVEARRNPLFRAVLQKSSLNVPDGSGLLWAARRQSSSLPERVAGVDLLKDICAVGSVPPVFLLGAAPGVAERAALRLRESNPGLRVAGTYSGTASPEDDDQIVARINSSGAEILFVAYGAPKQDLWIDRNLPKMLAVRVAMGVGGSFDFLAGTKKRAPAWMRRMALEWLYRLIREPSRLKRIFTAVVVFPLLILREGSRDA